MDLDVMTRVRVALSLISSIVFTAEAVFAWTSFGFFQDDATWYASDIVVVSDKGVVLEVWAGSLERGQTVSLDELGVVREQMYEPLDDPGLALTDLSSGHFPGSGEVIADRMVLFLSDRGGQRLLADQPRWQPAIDGRDIRFSVVWTAGEKLFCWHGRNHKDSSFAPVRTRRDMRFLEPTRLDAFRKTSLRLLRIRADLRSVAEIVDRRERAMRLVPFVAVGNGTGGCRLEALASLSECGEDALPAFRSLLHEEKLSPHLHLVMDYLAKGRGERAKPILVEILREEVRYWRAAEGRLRRGWGVTTAVTHDNFHFRRLGLALLYLARVDVGREESGLALELRDVLSSLPPKMLRATRDSRDDDYRMMMTIDEVLQKGGSPYAGGRIPGLHLRRLLVFAILFTLGMGTAWASSMADVPDRFRRLQSVWGQGKRGVRSMPS